MLLQGTYTGYHADIKDRSQRLGLTVADVISWRERVFLTACSRRQEGDASSGRLMVSRYTGQPYDASLGEIGDGPRKEKAGWRPAWSLAVKPLKNLNVYGSHTDTSIDQSYAYTPEGEQLDPRTYVNTEIGAKYGVGNWLLS